MLERPLDHDVALKAICAIDACEVHARRTACTDRFDELIRPDTIAIVRDRRLHAAARCSRIRTKSPTATHDKFQRLCFATASSSSASAAAVG